MEHTDHQQQPSTAAAATADGPLMLPPANSSSRSSEQASQHRRGQRRRAGTSLPWGLTSLLLLAWSFSSGCCLAFAPPPLPVRVVGRRSAAAGAGARVGSSGLPTRSLVAQRLLDPSSRGRAMAAGRRAGGANMALGLFKKGKHMPVGVG